MPSTNPVDVNGLYARAEEKAYVASEQLHRVFNGDATTEVQADDGLIPSLRKALVDNFYFKDPIDWVIDDTETVFNQPRKFVNPTAPDDVTYWFAPGATTTNVIAMGGSPFGDDNWQPWVNGFNKGNPLISWAVTVEQYGQKVINVPFKFKIVGNVFINGAHQDPDQAYEYDSKKRTVTFSQGLEVGDNVVIQFGVHGGIVPSLISQLEKLRDEAMEDADRAEYNADRAEVESSKVVNATKLGLQVNNLHTTRDAITWKAGLYVEDPTQLYAHDGTEYLPNPKAVPFPFTTSETFNVDNWVLSKLTTQSDLRGFGYSSDTSILANTRISNAARFKQGGSICILGDSITVGEGATNLKDSYASRVFDALANHLSGGYGEGNEINYNWSTMGGVALTGQSAGTSGPLQRSQIISVNGTITIHRPTANKIAFLYDRSPSSGRVEVRQNGVLLNTIDCSGSHQKNTLSPYTDINIGGNNVQFKVINSSVEFLAVVPIKSNPEQPDIMIPHRIAVSGWNTTHFLQSPEQMISIGECANNFNSSQNIYILAVGTNDIYTAARSPEEYVANLSKIGSTLQSYNKKSVVCLVVPPQADESKHPVAIKKYTYSNYRTAIYKLAEHKKWGVIDHYYSNLNEQGLYVDGLHPSDYGHTILAQKVVSCMGFSLIEAVDKNILDEIGKKSDATLYRVRAPISRFTGTTTRELSLVGLGVTSSDFINNVYVRFKTSGVMIPYQDCADLKNNIGLQMMRSFSGAEYSVAKLFYKSLNNDGKGFVAPIGALYNSIIDDPSDAEVIIEFTRSLEIKS